MVLTLPPAYFLTLFHGQKQKKIDVTRPVLLKPLTSSHPAFTCSKLTKKTLQQDVKYVQN